MDLPTAEPQSQELVDQSNITKYKSSIGTVVQFYSPYLILNIVLAVEQWNDKRFKAALNITHSRIPALVKLAFYCWKIRRILVKL